MAANEILVKRYEDVVAEVKKRDEDIERIINESVDKVRSSDMLKGIMTPEQIEQIDNYVDETRNDGCKSIVANKRNLWAMQLELYKDICDQLDSIRAEIAELKS